MTSILLVDDEPLVAKLHGRAIAAAGYTAVIAQDGEMALEILAESAPALIITDMNMPGMSGFALTQLLRQNGYAQPIILLSGDDHVSLLTEGLRAGIDDFLVKGMPFTTLSALLHFWVAGPFQRLPAHIRRDVLDYFDMAWPIGPPIQQLRSDLPMLESRASATLKDLLMHAPDDFGSVYADRVRLLGVAEGILTTLTRSDPLARLRLPDVLARILVLHPPTAMLLSSLDSLFNDATFQHARETLRLT
jgi:CheY-like chemotaxis protein